MYLVSLLLFSKNMVVNHPTLNIPNMKYILPPEPKKSDSEAQNWLFESKLYSQRPKIDCQRSELTFKHFPI